MLDADDAGHPLAGVIAREVGVAFLEEVDAPRIIVEAAGDGNAHSGEVGAAIDGVDGVGEGVDRFGVGIAVLDGGFDADVVDLFSTEKTGWSTSRLRLR